MKLKEKIKHIGWEIHIDNYHSKLDQYKNHSQEYFENATSGWFFRIYRGKELMYDVTQYDYYDYSKEGAIRCAKSWIENFIKP